jgi:ABC-2 type transport system ATP-binding protein
MIETEDLTKRFGMVLALDSLTIRTAEKGVCCLVGPNGAGKTTMLSIIATLLHPSSGDAYVNEVSVVRNPGRVRDLIGVCVQESHFYSQRTALENLLLVAKSKTCGPEGAMQEITGLLDYFELGSTARERVAGLSHGTRKVLEVLQAFVGNPRIVLLDEPLSGLDPVLKGKLMEFIRTYSKENLVVLSTHQLSDVEQLASQIVFLHQGKMILEGSLCELRREHGVMRLRVENAPARCLGILRKINGITVQERDGLFTVKYTKDMSSKVLSLLLKRHVEVSYMEKGRGVEEVFLDALKRENRQQLD